MSLFISTLVQHGQCFMLLLISMVMSPTGMLVLFRIWHTVSITQTLIYLLSSLFFEQKNSPKDQCVFFLTPYLLTTISFVLSLQCSTKPLLLTVPCAVTHGSTPKQTNTKCLPVRRVKLETHRVSGSGSIGLSCGGSWSACMALCPTSPPVTYKACVQTCMNNVHECLYCCKI